MILDKLLKPKKSIIALWPQGSDSTKKQHSTKALIPQSRSMPTILLVKNLTSDTIKLYENRLENRYNVYIDVNWLCGMAKGVSP